MCKRSADIIQNINLDTSAASFSTCDMLWAKSLSCLGYFGGIHVQNKFEWKRFFLAFVASIAQTKTEAFRILQILLFTEVLHTEAFIYLLFAEDVSFQNLKLM